MVLVIRPGFGTAPLGICGCERFPFVDVLWWCGHKKCHSERGRGQKAFVVSERTVEVAEGAGGSFSGVMRKEQRRRSHTSQGPPAESESENSLHI